MASALAKFWLVWVWLSMRRCPCGLSLGLKSQSLPQSQRLPCSARSKARASQGRSLSRSNGRRLNPKNSCFEWPPLEILDIRSNGPEGGSSSAPPGATPPSFRILIKTRCGPPERGFGVDLPQILVGLGVGLTWFNMAGCHLA